MKTQVLAHFLAVAMVMVSGSAFAEGKGAAKAGAKDEDAIKAVVAEFGTAWGKHDPKAMTALYADDATILNPWGRVAKGKAEVEKLFTDEHVGASAPLKDTTWTATIPMWRALGANFAFADLDADMTGMKAPDGKAMSGKHHLALVLAKKGNKWAIADARAYFLAPAAPPPAAKPAAAPAATPAKK